MLALVFLLCTWPAVTERVRKLEVAGVITGYRAEIKNELQCMFGAPGQCNVEIGRASCRERVSSPV